MKSYNYQLMYLELKQEYDQYKLETDEILKEYEITVKILTETGQDMKKERDIYEEKFKESIRTIQSMKESTEKINELNIKNEKLSQEIEELNQNKITTNNNDIEVYINKINEYEKEMNGYKEKLKCALEENFSIQSDFDNYKIMIDEQLQRKEQELNDAKDEIDIKEKLIMELHKNKKENDINEDNYSTQKLLEQYNMNMKKQRIMCHSNRIFRTFSTGSLINNILTPVINSGIKIPEKYADIYKNSCNEGMLSLEEKQKLSERINEETEKIKEEENDNENNENNENDDNKEVKERKGFDGIEVVKGESFGFRGVGGNKGNKKQIGVNGKVNVKQNGSNRNGNANLSNGGNMGNVNCGNEGVGGGKGIKGNNKKIAENLKEMLVRIQQRKNELLDYKKEVNERLEKMGIKVKQNC